MKTLALLLALLIGAFGAHFLIEDRGYVLVHFRGYNIEMSVPILVLAMIAFYLLVRAVIRLLKAPVDLGRKAASYKERRSRDELTRGLLQLTEGRWAKSEKLLVRHANKSDAPMLNFLGAARAAQELGANDRRDAWLEMAHEQAKNDPAAVLLTQAQLQADAGEDEQALATLAQLGDRIGSQPQAMALQARLSEKVEDWATVRALLPKLERLHAVPEARITELTRAAHIAALHDAARARDLEALRTAFHSIPRKQRKDAKIVAAYARALRVCGAVPQAETLLRKHLNKHWDANLVLLYGEIPGEDASKQLQHAETWLKTRGEDPALLLTAARIAMRAELWGKARSYLESSIAIDPRVDTYHLFGRLLEQLGEGDEAAGAFRAGLALATGESLSEVPALRAPEPS